jgi:hypothetical protein
MALVLLNKSSAPSPLDLLHLELLPSPPTYYPCCKLKAAMSGLAGLGLSLAALLGLGMGASLCLSRQLRAEGDYVLGGLFSLGLAEEGSLYHRTQPNGIVCTRYRSRQLGVEGGAQAGCPQVCGTPNLET